MKGIISKFLNDEITLEEAIKHHTGIKTLIELIIYNEELSEDARINTRNLGKASGLSPQISTILKKLEKEGYIIIYTPEERKKPTPAKIPLPTSKLKRLIQDTR